MKKIKILSKRDILSTKDIIATNPSQPFGGSTVSMGGGSAGAYTSNQPSPVHQGPPPVATNPASTWNCPHCSRMCDDAEDLEKHLWKDHGIRTRKRHREY